MNVFLFPFLRIFEYMHTGLSIRLVLFNHLIDYIFKIFMVFASSYQTLKNSFKITIAIFLLEEKSLGLHLRSLR